MITLIGQPGDIALSKNQMVYRLKVTDAAGDPYGPKGVRSQITSDGEDLNPGDVITIDWTEPDGTVHTIDFTAKIGPVSATDLPASSASFPTFTDYLIDIANQIESHYLIAPHFKLYAMLDMGTYYLWIETRQIDEDWMVHFDISQVTATGYASLDFPNIAADNTPANHKVLLDVFFESNYLSGDYRRKASLEGTIDTAGIIEFNIENIIQSELEITLADPPLPPFNETEMKKADILRRYYVRYREEFDGGSEDWNFGLVKLVLCGGIAQNLFADYDFFSNLTIENSFLTWYPDGKTIDTIQPEYLAWYNYTGATQNILLEINLYNEDGYDTTIHRYDSPTPINVAPHEVVLIPVGYTQIDISDEETLKYSVRVVDKSSDWEGGNPDYFSQPRQFYVDYQHYREIRYIQYLNGFCIPQTLRCIGDFSNELQVSREKSVRILTPGYSSYFTQLRQHQVDYDNRFTYRSGFLSDQEVDALQELKIYNQAFEVYEEGYIPLYIEDKNYDIADTENFLNAIEIQATPALKQKNYSNIMIPLSAEQNGWRTSGGSFWKTVFGLTWKISE